MNNTDNRVTLSPTELALKALEHINEINELTNKAQNTIRTGLKEIEETMAHTPSEEVAP